MASVELPGVFQLVRVNSEIYLYPCLTLQLGADVRPPCIRDHAQFELLAASYTPMMKYYTVVVAPKMRCQSVILNPLRMKKEKAKVTIAKAAEKLWEEVRPTYCPLQESAECMYAPMYAM